MFWICLKPHYQVYAALEIYPLNIVKFKADEDFSSIKRVLNMFLTHLEQEFLKQV